MEYALSHRASRMAIFHSQLGQAHEQLMNATQENKSYLLEHGEQVNSSCGKGGNLQFFYRFLRNLFRGASIEKMEQ
jgi:hypothetical protein